MPKLVDPSEYSDTPEASAPKLKEVSAADFQDPSEIAGMSPEHAIPDSPLGIMDRAMLGWARTPREQEKLLRQTYDDVAIHAAGDEAGFVVKQKDGKWYQVDPNMAWTPMPGLGGLGATVPSATVDNLKKAAGKVAQYAGEYGLKTVAATTAGAAAVPAGMAAGAAGGPWGAAAGGAIAGISAAALASSGAEAVDLASRKVLQPEGAPGRTPYSSPEELNQQMIASAVFGAQDFAAGQALKGVGQGASKAFGKALKAFTDSPEGHQSARKLLSMMGADERLVEARLKDPIKTAMYDDMVQAPATSSLRKSSIDMAEDSALGKIEAEVGTALKRQQGEFAALEASPAARNLKLDNSKHFFDSIDGLKNQKILLPNERVNPDAVLGEGDKRALSFLKSIQAKSASMGYGDIRFAVNQIGALFNKGIENPSVRRALAQLKTDLNASVVNGLDEESGTLYANIMKKYGAANNLAEEMGSVAESSRRFTLGQKLLSENRNASKELVDGLFESKIDPDSIYNFYQIQAAKQSAPWFAKGRTFKQLPRPNMDKFAATAIGTLSNAQQLGSAVAGSIPYTDKALRLMKRLDPVSLRTLLTNPSSIDQLTSGIAAAAMAEQQTTDELLRQAGVK